MCNPPPLTTASTSARDPGEVAGNRVLDGAGRHALVEALLQVAVEQAVNQARRE